MTIRCAPWFYKDKVALVGDAAHAVVPFYGQGMNAAFEDCVVLDECLAQFPDDRERAFAEYFSRRKENADALADLAVHNFIEMRDKTASKTFRAKKKLDHLLEGLLPGIYLPLYTMVTFTRIPYAEAARRARLPGPHRLRRPGCSLVYSRIRPDSPHCSVDRQPKSLRVDVGRWTLDVGSFFANSALCWIKRRCEPLHLGAFRFTLY